MAITQAVCNSFKRDVLQEGHQIKTDTLKIALFTSAASLSAGTSVFSSSNEVASSGGYASGGGTLSGVTISLGATSAAGGSAAGSKIFVRNPSFAAAIESIRPNWPPPSMPMTSPFFIGLCITGLFWNRDA